MHINLAVIGPGLVGKEFIKQVLAFKHPRVDLRIIGAVSSKQMVLGPIQSEMNLFLNGIQSNMEEFIAHCEQNLPCIVIDSTSSENIAQLYPRILQKLSIVTPNKKGFSASLVYIIYIRICMTPFEVRLLGTIPIAYMRALSGTVD